jgi:hypothetical protein
MWHNVGSNVTLKKQRKEKKEISIKKTLIIKILKSFIISLMIFFILSISENLITKNILG